MRDLHGHCHAAQHDNLVAPVELVGFARCERQWHISSRRLARMRPAPGPGVASNCVVAAIVAQCPQFLENADQGQPFARALPVRSRSISAFQRPSLGRG
jgi:hypothetical protein